MICQKSLHLQGYSNQWMGLEVTWSTFLVTWWTWIKPNFYQTWDIGFVALPRDWDRYCACYQRQRRTNEISGGNRWSKVDMITSSNTRHCSWLLEKEAHSIAVITQLSMSLERSPDPIHGSRITGQVRRSLLRRSNPFDPSRPFNWFISVNGSGRGLISCGIFEDPVNLQKRIHSKTSLTSLRSWTMKRSLIKCPNSMETFGIEPAYCSNWF